MAGESGAGSGKTVKMVGLGVLVLIALIVTIQNSHVVVFYFLFWQVGISQVLLIPLVLLVGFAVGMMTYSLIGRRRRG